mgnify:CR=1
MELNNKIIEGILNLSSSGNQIKLKDLQLSVGGSFSDLTKIVKELKRKNKLPYPIELNDQNKINNFLKSRENKKIFNCWKKW